MRITFVLPSPVRIPMGGAKVVYEHAKGLAARGHEVVVVGPRRAGDDIGSRAMEVAVRVRDRLHRVADAPYYRAEGVETRVVPVAAGRHVPDADAVIATGAQTAPWVRDLPEAKGAKLYFIQHVETFVDPDAPQTWHYPLAKITCARWLKERIEAEGEPVLGYVPNAIDPAEFFVERPLDDRPPRVVALYHRQAFKGPDVLMAVLDRLKAALPEVEADLFTARPPSHRLPSWATIHVRPSLPELRALFNGAAVFLHTSRAEGWPLVPMEAGACGCAIVASANPGISEYYEGGTTMVAAPIGDAEALAEGALDLFRHPDRRLRFAEAARDAIAQYRWADNTATFESLVEQAVAQAV